MSSEDLPDTCSSAAYPVWHWLEKSAIFRNPQQVQRLTRSLGLSLKFICQETISLAPVIVSILVISPKVSLPGFLFCFKGKRCVIHTYPFSLIIGLNLQGKNRFTMYAFRYNNLVLIKNSSIIYMQLTYRS